MIIDKKKWIEHWKYSYDCNQAFRNKSNLEVIALVNFELCDDELERHLQNYSKMCKYSRNVISMKKKSISVKIHQRFLLVTL